MMKKIFFPLLISFSIGLTLTGLSCLNFYKILELKLYDLRMNLRKAPLQDKNIIYLEMDEEAIKNIGRWPWPRTIFAQIVATIKSLEAKQIIFDVTFAQKSQFVVEPEKAREITLMKNNLEESLNLITKNEGLSIDWKLKQAEEISQQLSLLEQNIAGSIEGHDKIFAESLKENNVFIGCEFLVAYEPKDVKRDSVYTGLKESMRQWLAKNTEKTFDQLPPAYKKNLYFTKDEITDIFVRTKLYNLIKTNTQLDIEEAANKINMPVKDIRINFNIAQEEAIKEKIIEFMDKNPSLGVKEATWYYEIDNQDIQASFKQIWENIEREKTFEKLFSLKKPSRQKFLKAVSLTPPILMFMEKTEGVGFLNGIPDADGVLRASPLFVAYKDKIYPNISMVSVINILKPRKIDFIPNKFVVFSGILNTKKSVKMPVDEKTCMLINWAGPWKDTFRHISCADVYGLNLLRQNVENNLKMPQDFLSPQQKKILDDDMERLREKEQKLKKEIKNSICIVGLTAPGTHDYNPMPYEPAYPMVGTHANIINSILTNSFLRKVPEKINYILLFSLTVIVSLLLAVLGPITGLAATAAVCFAFSWAALFFFTKGIWINMASPLLLSVFSYIGITSFKFAAEEKEKRWIKKAFAKYVSKQVMEEILKNPAKLTLGGERKTLTVLFSDIRSFTTYSEKRKPEEVVAILNEYLDAMTKVIFDNNGTLDKYVGDEIMVIFGAPHYEEPSVSAKRAVITAGKMMEKLMELRDIWIARNIEPLDIGIGINTGEMVVGNMGSSLVMDYTVIGDAVNLGARIEALTRKYNNNIMISEFTYEYVKDIIEANPLETIKVKGKNEPIMMYEMVAIKTDKNDGENNA